MTTLLLASENPLHHVVDHTWITTDDGTFTILSNHIIMMMLAGVLLMLFMPMAVRTRHTGDVVRDLTPRGPRNLIELICDLLRNSVARPFMGEHTDRFIPYIWSVFFFILGCNLLGLMPFEPVTKMIFGKPIYGTATGNIWTTGTLAACTLLMIVINGLRIQGMTFVKHFFMGPFPINCLIAFLEVVGLIAKTFALTVRLFANMCAGHILLAVLVSFIAMAGAAGAAMGFTIAVPVVLGCVAINMLELFVAFLQAFIFTFLSCVFIGQAVNIHHDHHDEEPGHDHGHGHAAHAHTH